MKIEFYHTFDIPEKGIKVEGQWDLNPTAPHIFKHVNVAGKTVLDVACRDGWYGFCFEKGMGAKEVTQLDIDDRLARRYIATKLDSRNHFFHKNGYSLHDWKEKEFDVTFAGDILCHLQDPIRFLRNIHHVTKEKFYYVADVWDAFKMWYAGYPWMFGKKELTLMMEFAGFLNPTILAEYEIKSKYWSSRGCLGTRKVALFECSRNPSWSFGGEESITPANDRIDIQELTYELELEK